MTTLEVVIGVDIGTTSTKSVVFDTKGKVIATHAVEYPLFNPKPSWAEQNPGAIFKAFIESVSSSIKRAGVNANQIIGIGMSTAMHSLIAVDEEGKPLTEVIVWADNRSVLQSKKLMDELNGLEIYKRTGTPIHPMSPLSKLLWFKEEEPALYHRAHKFISIKEYIVYKLYGEYVVDYSIASATGLFNLKELDWDTEVLGLLKLDKAKLSTPVATTHILNNMKLEFASELGIKVTTPFVIGASDGVLANVGVGAVSPKETAVTIGTSGAIRTVAPEPLTDEQGRTFCYALTENHWVVGGPTNNGGIMLRWLRDEFGNIEKEESKRLQIDPYDLMIQQAEKIPAGANGLLFLPFLSGERAPYWNANARGTFFGISLHHKREHFIRAVLEGVILSVFSVGVALRSLTGTSSVIRASGGFARSEVWRQILSDVTGKEVLVPESHEASSLGAAALVLLATNRITSLEDVQEWIHIKETHEPNLTNNAVYMEMYYMYDRLYHKLKDEFDIISQFQKHGYF